MADISTHERYIMPTTVKELLKAFNIPIIFKVKWGEHFFEVRQGIYVVSLSDEPSKHKGIKDKIAFDDTQINNWIKKLPNFLIDGQPATAHSLKARLSEFWLADESILYIGKAPKRSNGKGLSNRVQEYYKTIIGSRSPHSGGQWIKVLKDLNEVFVYCGLCDDPSYTEERMLKHFMDNVSDVSLSKLYDKNFPLPFANIRFKGNKKHGLKNQRN